MTQFMPRSIPAGALRWVAASALLAASAAREPLNNSARSAFQSEKPQIVWCDASDSSRSYGRGSRRASCDFSGETLTGRVFAGAPPRLSSLIWNDQTALAQARPEPPAKSPSRPRRVIQRFPSADDPVVISRELCNGLWIVPLTWTSEDSGKSHSLTAVFDTGGSNLLIDPDGLERASGKRVKAGQRVRMEGVSASALNFSTFRPRVREMSHIGAALGLDFDVFLPFPAFDGKLLVLDYPAREMRIEEGALPEPDGETVFSSAGPDDRPWLTVDLAGRERRVLIDSGSNGRLELKRLGRLDWLSGPVVSGVSTRMDKYVQRREGRILNRITVANLEFDQPLVSITGDTELMGVQVLKHFVLTFDQANQRVRFEPQVEGPVRMRPKRSSGALLRADPGGYFEVARVIPDTPAAQAGLKAGDRVVELDGTPVDERGCKKLDEPDTLRQRFGVQRGDVVEQLEIDFIDLIE